MDLVELERKLNGLPPKPKCNNFYKEFGAIKAKEYCCPNCNEEPDVEGYIVDGKEYPKFYNENKSYGDSWDWDEVHCCENCKTVFWFTNGI